MKVVRTSNFDREDSRGDQYVVPGTEGMGYENAGSLAVWLNERAGSRSEDFFVPKPDEYVLPPHWEP